MCVLCLKGCCLYTECSVLGSRNFMLTPLLTQGVREQVGLGQHHQVVCDSCQLVEMCLLDCLNNILMPDDLSELK